MNGQTFWRNDYPKSWTHSEAVRKEFERMNEENERIQANAIEELILIKKLLELLLPQGHGQPQGQGQGQGA